MRRGRRARRVVGPVWAGLAVFGAFGLAGCSDSPEETPAEAVASPAAVSEDPDAGPDTIAAGEPALDPDEFADVVRLEAGQQVTDANGDLIAVHGYAPWPDAFDTLPGPRRARFPFAGELTDLGASELVALDVAMCAAGITESEGGTVEFFAQRGADTPLPADSSDGREVPVPHPLVSPGFTLPDRATCTRGWLPVRVAAGQDPDTARYVLTVRKDAASDPERYLYEWQIEPTSLERTESPDDFAAGETVTYREGPLVGTTVRVAGWAELVGRPVPIEGTRLVAVSLQVCAGSDPSSGGPPSLGLTVDGWNLVAPLDGAVALFSNVGADGCADGWVEFAVPLGAVPTGFFTTDGIDPVGGYAEWSLAGSALPVPE